MIVTEEEAKTKHCPESFGPGRTDFETVPARRMCMASECMAWRWWGVLSIEADGEEIYVAMKPETLPRDLDRKTDDAPVEMHSLGYCGKAGKP